MSRTTEDSERIFWILVAPLVWAFHFLITYITAAFWCAKVEPGEGPLGLSRTLVGIYTGMALLFIALLGVRFYRRCRTCPRTEKTFPHDAQARRRFLGMTGLLLAMLSAVAVVFVALPALFFTTCR